MIVNHGIGAITPTSRDQVGRISYIGRANQTRSAYSRTLGTRPSGVGDFWGALGQIGTGVTDWLTSREQRKAGQPVTYNPTPYVPQPTPPPVTPPQPTASAMPGWLMPAALAGLALVVLVK